MAKHYRFYIAWSCSKMSLKKKKYDLITVLLMNWGQDEMQHSKANKEKWCCQGNDNASLKKLNGEGLKWQCQYA